MTNHPTIVHADPRLRAKFETWADYSFHAIGFDTGNERDKALCTCGWNDTPYWDGVGLAWMEWRQHVIKATVASNKLSTEY